jgi:hypothetical protein
MGTPPRKAAAGRFLPLPDGVRWTGNPPDTRSWACNSCGRKWTITVAVPAAHTSVQGPMTTDVYPPPATGQLRVREWPRARRSLLTSAQTMTL